MFEQEKQSLGQLDDSELGIIVKHLDGEPLEDLFEEYLGEGEEPTTWLDDWSGYWSWEPLFSIDGLDPLSMSCYLIEDSSCDEYWFCEQRMPALIKQVGRVERFAMLCSGILLILCEILVIIYL
jgi:hypothetical protein